MFDLQRSAGNRAVNGLLEHTGDTTSGAPPAFLPGPVKGALQHGSGRPLDPWIRVSMETRFRHDFSGVRVHTDAQASQSADAVDAEAYTVGEDVIFGEGLYAPHTIEGRRLLAHELAHVVQQRRGGGDPASAPANEAAAERAGDGATPASGPIAADGASGVGLARKPKREEGPSISHFEDDFQTVVFDRPVSIAEAVQVLWNSPPSSPAITPDPAEQPVDGRQRRYKVDVRFELGWRHPFQLTATFRQAAEEALPKVDVVQQLQERGLPPEVARVAPSLPYEREQVTDVYDVTRLHALHAKWERFWGRPVVDWETEPGRKEITREVDVLHRFPGTWTVQGKQYPGDWLVRTKNGVIEAWQLKPPLEAYVAASNGDQDIGQRHFDAAMTTQNLVLSYWQQGHSLDDAMGLMRADVEIDFKSAVWSGAGLVQSASGVSMIRGGFAHEVAEAFSARTAESSEAAGGMAARRSDESAPPSNMRARMRENRQESRRLRGPRMDRGSGPRPPEASAQRLRATGTEAETPVSGAPVNERAAPLTGAPRTTDVPVATERSGGTRRPPGTVKLPDPRQFDAEAPTRVAPEPRIRGAQQTGNESFTTTESNARKVLASPTETEKALTELEPRRTAEAGQKETRYGVKQHSEAEWSSLAGHAIEPLVVQAWATPLEQAGFTVYRTDAPSGPNLAPPARAAEGTAPRKEFLPAWYEQRYQPFPAEFSKIFPGEGPDAIAVSSSRNMIVVFDSAPTYSASHFQSKAALAQRVADAFPQARVYVQEGYWGEPTSSGGYVLLRPRLVRPSRAASQ